jgi:hypothetical protein
LVDLKLTARFQISCSLSLSDFNENADLAKKNGKEKFQVANENGAQQLRVTTKSYLTFSD